ncbi:isocitrate lyase/PEP mutase family protein [Caenimonas aquaedulcis]|uniref:Isocitrate lyase/PEP mutase family protein n=1 Tax=Caenimonas aquaedulcis TaxID=2793270 RepID=A0A931MED1_9BURK|nr:isocitrate lyase/PEP mutase family protein [Caenimonas aquaedulcis]MBG9386404.1 isocitrate lyase/PEP mutase family protein [Caenimonas aquaedulcis]
MQERPTTRLRRLIAQPGCVMAPGAADALTARMIARAGFDAIHMTGFGTSIGRLGMPDIGLLTASEMVDNASRIADASGLCIVADADTGYGNAMNVRRTVRDYEKAGVAALHLEDQVAPKRCGHLAGKRVIPAREMVGKIKAACDARQDADLVIIARTDVLAIDGMDAVFERGRQYREAGADMIFVDAPVGLDQMHAVARGLAGIPLFANIAASGKTPDIPAAELGEMGFKLAIYANFAILSAIPAIQKMLAELKGRGSLSRIAGTLASFGHIEEIAGMAEHDALEGRYGLTP